MNGEVKPGSVCPKRCKQIEVEALAVRVDGHLRRIGPTLSDQLTSEGAQQI